jgi:hypothetical protein
MNYILNVKQKRPWRITSALQFLKTKDGLVKATVAALLAIAFVLTLATTAAMANTNNYPTSAMGVEPVLFADGPGGNVECSQVGMYEFASERFDDGEQFAGTVGPIAWSTSTDGKFVSWEGVHGGLAVIVKGGPGAHVYYYDGSYTYDSQLASPLNPGGQIPELSNITFCWNPAEVTMQQWCSPGYWRQPHHLSSWEATGYSPDDLFYDEIGYYPPLSKQGTRQGATTNPTLWEVLQKPQWYGGDAFNAVGDLLSEAHPDVNFHGTRVEDSCPL